MFDIPQRELSTIVQDTLEHRNVVYVALNSSC